MKSHFKAANCLAATVTLGVALSVLAAVTVGAYTAHGDEPECAGTSPAKKSASDMLVVDCPTLNI